MKVLYAFGKNQVIAWIFYHHEPLKLIRTFAPMTIVDSHPETTADVAYDLHRDDKKGRLNVPKDTAASEVMRMIIEKHAKDIIS